VKGRVDQLKEKRAGVGESPDFNLIEPHPEGVLLNLVGKIALRRYSNEWTIILLLIRVVPREKPPSLF